MAPVVDPQQERRRLSMIVEHLPDAVLLETPERTVSQTNKAFCTMFGIDAPPAALVGADCEQAAIGLGHLWQDPPEFMARVHAILAAGEPVVGERIELTDGRVLERDFFLVPVHEQRIETAWIYRDVTAADAARRDAESLARARSELLATISHDVRTPVVGIVGMVDILLQQPLDHRTRELVESVRSSASAMTTMLDDLLDLSRADAGRLELSVDDASICDVVESVAGMVGPIAQRKSLPLVSAVAHDVPDAIRTDPGRLRQILLNLVSNAVKFSDSGAVTLTAGRDGSDLVVRVADSGPGMAPQVVGRLFEQYVQGGADVQRRYGGAGLGLAIAGRLTAALGGTITVESTLGEGSTFTVRLPGAVVGGEHVPVPLGVVADVRGPERSVAAVTVALRRAGVDVRPGPAPDVTLHVVVCGTIDEAQRLPAAPAGTRQLILVPAALATCPPLPGRAVALPWTRERLVAALRDDWGTAAAADPAAMLPAGTRVLLAEDEPSNRTIITEMLRRLQAEVVAVGTGLEAVEALAADRFDVVLMDLSMPVMGGSEAVETIRQRLPADRRPPILALTADPRSNPAIRPGSGFAGHVRKPVTSSELSRAVTAVLGEPDPEAPVGGTPVDVEVLRVLVEEIGDVEVVTGTLDVFLEELPGRLEAMGDALRHDRFEELRDVAHALKSAARLLGAASLSDLCRDLEAVTAAQARTGSSSGGDLSPLVDALHSEAFRVAQWLWEFRDEGYPGLAPDAARSGT